ncbi:bifunctional ornithine acetyltransferase/N-acetylglutamate synthase [Papillibacter cinnamivorans]|uniref:Arginine biosynthesis bifunctional protein ArgJ n=1 Tax=Papillibacter cinnamivorans DSM 12816 TaxID=1122930 RepID=A0A1W2AX96_9FIRM|nr:bifunctional ornithine acetyltransferase/N-acetylglutamate synthase [Papillibacter cinnamivorans]SMC65082.1 glutamate N-acetyltransferase [Papillibacter cinnamivorans DSM 12816]
MQEITGGVAAPIGFTAAGIHCGVKNKNPEKKDVALIYSEVPCAAAAVYTKNRVKAAPIWVTMENLSDGKAQAVICNSGNANACAPGGTENAKTMCKAAARTLNIPESDVVVASTGVIGQPLNIGVIEAGIPALVSALSKDGSDAAARAIMTTDLMKKEIAVRFNLDGKTVTMGGIAKGSGMIHPNMGTMLCFITTDAAVEPVYLRKLLLAAAERTFNRVSVDGDTSTNDMCAVLTNGLAGNTVIAAEGKDSEAFLDALVHVCRYLARCMAEDGEGATHLVTAKVGGASDNETAAALSMAVVSSSLVKAAMFGADANWGRVLCAMGYSGADFRPEATDVYFRSKSGEILVCSAGTGISFDEAEAKRILSEKEIIIDIRLSEGGGTGEAWGCDLTYDYVRINGDYRT